MATTHRVAKTTVPATPAEPDVPGLLLQPDNPIALMLFGHGAGTPMRAPLMNQMAHALADHGIATFRYNYPYSHRLEADYTEDLIDPLDVLLATTRAAANAARRLAPDLPLFLGGRSMSSQVMSLALAQEPWPQVRGLICYVYPTRWRVLLNNTVAHPSCHSERSAAEPRNLAFSPDPVSVPTVAHLPHVPVPMLFIQGSRDPEYCDLTHLQPVLDQLGPHATLHVIQGADHSYELPGTSNRTQQHAITEAATTTATWIRQQLQTSP